MGLRDLQISTAVILTVAVVSAAAANSTNGSAPDIYRRIGCFNDGSNRDLPTLHNGHRDTNRLYCWNYCRLKGFLFFGLQGNAWCTCGNSYGKHGRADESQCQSPCTGHGQTCGGSMKNEVFSTGVENSANFRRIGCFIDATPRDLPECHNGGTNTSRLYCWNYCALKGYKYFGLQSGSWCTCGNSYGRHGSAAGLCSQRCSGNSQETCGEFMKNEIFSTGVETWDATKSTRLGCFLDGSARDLPLVHNAEQSASRQYCWHYCKSKGYKYFGLQAGQYCTCGDSYGKYGRTSNSDCIMPCTDEAGTTCGASMRNEVFTTGLDWRTNSDVHRIGCFADAAERDLPIVVFMDNQASKFKCWSYCRSQGYRFFGLQSGTFCTCGNSFGRHGQVGDSACGNSCGGDPGSTCGGVWRNEIFTTGIDRLGASRLGCFEDGANRDLPLVIHAAASANRQVCWHYCKLRGYSYFGLQAGQHCTCGKNYGRHRRVSDSECSMRCSGNSSEACGSGLRNEVFSTGVPEWENGVIRMGCFIDKTDKDMPELLKLDHLMSKYSCWTHCHSNGYKYFGLQSGQWCTCGNSFGRHGQTNDADCSQTCGADSSTTCGSSMKNEIFTTGIERWDVNVTRLGCFVDASGSRDLQLVHWIGAGNRRQVCWHFCQSRGYRYFGLKSGEHCACGNSFARHERVNDSECTAPCPAASTETCGGSGRTEIFSTGVGDWESGILSLGCFEDHSSRDLLELYHARAHAHKYFCWNYCRSRGYQYFGLQAGAWCTCGNIFSRYQKRSESDCSMPCEGDNSTKCGGGMRNLLFTTGFGQWERQATPLGCFEESPRNRTPPIVHRANDFSFGKHYCWLYCRSSSFKYFAMREDLKTCLCGNSFDRFGLVRDEECGENCLDEASLSCDAEARRINEIFSTGLEAWERKVTRLGCFNDEENQRDLPVSLDAGNRLTKQFCWNYCHARGHKYFALQDRRMCFCGSGFGRHGRAEDEECSDRCRGDSSITCGGELKNEVFTTGIGNWDAAVTRVGCFSKSTERDLLLEHDMGNLATHYLCWKRCVALGYKYFGMHDGQKCSCGNVHGTQTTYRCNTPCSGDRRTTCGGAGQSEVFTTGVSDSWRNATTRMGCFADKMDDPDIAPRLQHLGDAATRWACWRLCRSQGRRYFALQAAQWCACGDAFGRHGRAENNDCRLPCLGDPGETCGGHLRNEVFATGL